MDLIYREINNGDASFRMEKDWFVWKESSVNDRWHEPYQLIMVKRMSTNQKVNDGSWLHNAHGVVGQKNKYIYIIFNKLFKY